MKSVFYMVKFANPNLMLIVLFTLSVIRLFPLICLVFVYLHKCNRILCTYIGEIGLFLLIGLVFVFLHKCNRVISFNWPNFCVLT